MCLTCTFRSSCCSVVVLIAVTLCDMNEDGPHTKVDVDRECSECSAYLLQFRQPDVTWETYEYVDTTKNKKIKIETRKKLILVKKKN